MRTLQRTVGWGIALTAIVLGLVVRALLYIIPIAAAVFVGMWLYHHS